VSTLVDAPARVDGVQLIGDMVGSGYRTPPALVRRGDGQVLQLTPLLYLVLKAVDGRRSCAEIADLVGRGLGREVTEADVRSLVDGHLRPIGLLRCADGSEPELRRADPLLALKPRVAVTNPQTTRRLTDPFRVLFRPVVGAAVLLTFVAVVAWVFFEHGLAASAYDAFERPHLLLLVFVVSVLSGGFHEFGHAAAARYSGAQPGAMGAGLYLVWPAFYTDVTDSYRLGRGGRIRTDLGGLYFNAVVVVLTFVWWWATGWEALLLLVATQVLQMVQQLLPLLRFDGYHLLADIAGVPDLYKRIRPTLVGLLPHRWKAPENRVLTPWARAVITLWVLITVPMMALMLLSMVAAVPRLLGSAGSVVRADASALASAWEAWDGLDVAAHALQILGVVLTGLACALVLGRFGLRFFGGLARWSQDSFGKRLVAAVVSAAVLTMLCWAWWPNPGTYRPIQPGERGLFASFQPASSGTAALPQQAAAVPSRADALPAGAAAEQRLAGDEPLVAVFPEAKELPTEEDPALAVVLVPTDGAGAADPSGTPSPSSAPSPTSEPADDAWVFPFDQPLPPDDGDTQALAVNTTDDSVVYDVAFALVWADGDKVLNVNEAHAYASCSDCVAVAVAFQVVLIMDDAQVIVPQNLAVAANYQCYQCITVAIANQLVLSVQGEPGEEQLLALGEVWNRLLRFASTITSYSLTEITEQLESFKSEITAIVMDAPPVQSAPSSSPSAGPAGAPSPSPTAAVEPTAASTSLSEDAAAPPSQTGENTSPPSPTGESSTAPSSPTQTEPSSAPESSTTDSSAPESPTPESSTTADGASPPASVSP
jgi:putative peptide zinc metalloprotease protein